MPRVTATGRPLSLRRPVELPHGPLAELRVRAASDGLGARCAGVRHEPERREVGLVARLVEVLLQALQVRRHAEHGRGTNLRDGVDEGGRVEVRQHRDAPAGQQGARGEAQGSGVVDRRDDEVDVVGPEAPELALLDHEVARVVRLEQARPHTLRSTGRARREVHGPAQRVGREVDGWSVQEGPQGGRVVHDQRGVEVAVEGGGHVDPVGVATLDGDGGGLGAGGLGAADADLAAADLDVDRGG